MNIRILAAFSLLLFAMCQSPAQDINQKIDSLKSLLHNLKGKDRIETLYPIAWDCMPEELELTLLFSREAYSLALC